MSDLTPSEKRMQAIVDRATGNSTSVQPRFDPAETKDTVSFASMMPWVKTDFEEIPQYKSDSRLRSKWLQHFWPNEPYIAGLINSVVQIDRNRSWTLTGGRNQVARFTAVLHNYNVQPGRPSWRDGIGAASLAFHTTDIGALVELARMFKNGPLAGMYHIDPTRSVLTPDVSYPMKYYPWKPGKGNNVIQFAPEDFIRCASQINVAEEFCGLGYCALSRCIELTILMVAINRHQQEMLFARAPRGLLLLSNIAYSNWEKAMAIRDAKLDSVEQDWFGATAVLASANATVDAKLVALSQLPANFDQKIFTDLLMYGYALAFGYDPREFWPVSSGSFGTVSETAQQHESATGKGGKEFSLTFQEELQSNLPESLHFTFDARDVLGDKAEAEMNLLRVNIVKALAGPGALISPDQAMEMLAEDKIVPHEWTPTDIESSINDEGEEVVNPDEDVVSSEENDPSKEDGSEVVEQAMEYAEVRRAIELFPNEPIVQYSWPSGKTREIYNKNGDNPIAIRLKRLLNE